MHLKNVENCISRMLKIVSQIEDCICRKLKMIFQVENSISKKLKTISHESWRLHVKKVEDPTPWKRIPPTRFQILESEHPFSFYRNMQHFRGISAGNDKSETTNNPELRLCNATNHIYASNWRGKLTRGNQYQWRARGIKAPLFYHASIRSLSLGAPFWYVFFISVTQSLSIMHAKHYPRRKWREGGRDEHKVKTNYGNGNKLHTHLR